MDSTFGNWRNAMIGVGLTMVVVGGALAVAFRERLSLPCRGHRAADDAAAGCQALGGAFAVRSLR